MIFRVEVAVGEDTSPIAVARALDVVRGKLLTGRIPLISESGDYPSGIIRDDNGVKVGEWEVVE